MIDQDLQSEAALPRFAADADLLAGCRAGKTDAWDTLFDRYYPVAARFVFQLSGDFSHEDTEEICQDTFVAVVRNLASFGGRSSFQTWLLRIAANKAMDFREKTRAAKRGGSTIHISIDGTGDNDARPTEIPSRSPGPDVLLQAAETHHLIRQSLDRLGEPCREIIELRYYGDLSYADIAAELRLNPKTVSSRLSKCLDRLQIIAKEILPPELRLPSNL
ncbi:MAG: RNA polymerase sigma factor [Chthoniobacterales bacterium]